jgi:hypothetical protein
MRPLDSRIVSHARRLFRLLPPAALDRSGELLVLFRHLREAVRPQAFRASPVPFWRLLAALLAIVLGRHRLPP